MITQIMGRVEVKIASHISPLNKENYTHFANHYLCSRHLLEKKKPVFARWNVNFETATVLF